MMNFIKSLFLSKSNAKTSVEQYLENSISLEDLERRQKQINRGEAPFQKYTKVYTHI